MNHSVWTKGEPASLPEILDAREKRRFCEGISLYEMAVFPGISPDS